MPIYEYECSKCGKVYEVWQQLSDKPLKKCDECSGKVHKLISRSAFHLKGSGWYATDYAGKSGSSSSKSAAVDTGAGAGAGKDQSQKECTSSKNQNTADSE